MKHVETMSPQAHLAFNVLLVPIVRDLTTKSGSGRKTTKMGSHLVVAFHKLMRS